MIQQSWALAVLSSFIISLEPEVGFLALKWALTHSILNAEQFFSGKV